MSGHQESLGTPADRSGRSGRSSLSRSVLRSLAEDSEPRLIEAWPRERRLDRRRFQLLKRAYVEARYSTAYDISVDELNAILASVRSLRDLVAQVGRERLEELRAAAHA